MAYSFEQIKHNRVLIKQTDPLDLAITGYFIDLPRIKIAQNWGEDERFINKAVTTINNFARVAKSLTEGVTKTIGNRLDKAEGVGIERYWSAFTNNIEGILTEFTKNLGQETGLRTVAATSQEWIGPQVPTITMDFIIIEGEGDTPISKVTLNKVRKLLALCAPTYSDLGGDTGLTFDNWKGPAGFNGATIGTSGVSSILSSKQSGLVTLQLKSNGKTRLHLRRYLVVSAVSITGSEQLYTTEGTSPGYKWIKLSIDFQGACALPGTPLVQNGPSVQSLVSSELDEFDEIEEANQGNSETRSGLGGV